MSLPKGRLFIVSTPIGNLEDVTLRALRVLREVDFIACEDTRRALKLLNHYGIKKNLFSYFSPKETEKSEAVIKRLKKGKSGALISDAGTPLISDPGDYLLKRCIDEEIKIEIIPGPSSLTAAISLSALPKKEIHFLGFPKRKGMENYLKSLALLNGTLVFFERAERVRNFLSQAYKIFGEREAEIHRELTKIHEETIRGKLSALQNWKGKGEIVIIIEGCRNRKELFDKYGLEEFLSSLGIKKKNIKKLLTKID